MGSRHGHGTVHLLPAAYLPGTLPPVSFYESQGESCAMRLIGNKTKLLADIETFLGERGVTGGTLIDIFTGTSSVARHFKSRGFRVLANDVLSPCYNQAVAGVEINAAPTFERFLAAHARTLHSRVFRRSYIDWSEKNVEANGRDDDSLEPLRQSVHFLNEFVPPRDGLLYRCFSPEGPDQRRYFRPGHARKIDGILDFLREQRRGGTLERLEHHLLLNALLDAADRRANISGTYGAYLKRWQSNTEAELVLRLPVIYSSGVEGHRAFRRDANELIRDIEGDVLYLDPPYNHRQYAANYHVLQIMAEYHRIDDLESYESALYGKTGLRPYADLRSAFCVRRTSRRRPESGPGNVYEAMKDLLDHARVEHVVISYNEEGLLDREEIGELLASFSGTERFDHDQNFREVDYRRFRSDRDRAPVRDGSARRYRVIENKGKDRIGEWLFYARRPRQRSSRLGR
jgi:adenine-specific DNA-methyltransferase